VTRFLAHVRISLFAAPQRSEPLACSSRYATAFFVFVLPSSGSSSSSDPSGLVMSLLWVQCCSCHHRTRGKSFLDNVGAIDKDDVVAMLVVKEDAESPRGFDVRNSALGIASTSSVYADLLND